MHVSRHILVYRLKVKGVNLYTKKHLDICVPMIGYLIFWNGGSIFHQNSNVYLEFLISEFLESHKYFI
jgi:hypothetical protein